MKNKLILASNYDEPKEGWIVYDGSTYYLKDQYGIFNVRYELPLSSVDEPVDVDAGTKFIGISTNVARADHKHSALVGIPTNLIVGGSNIEGVSNKLSRSDHIHSLPPFGDLPGTFCQGNDARLSDYRTADKLKTNTSEVIIEQSDSPGPDFVLVSTDSSNAIWLDYKTLLGAIQINRTSIFKLEHEWTVVKFDKVNVNSNPHILEYNSHEPGIITIRKDGSYLFRYQFIITVDEPCDIEAKLMLNDRDTIDGSYLKCTVQNREFAFISSSCFAMFRESDTVSLSIRAPNTGKIDVNCTLSSQLL